MNTEAKIAEAVAAPVQGGEEQATAEAAAAAAAVGATSLAAHKLGHNAIQHAQRPAPPLKRPRASAAAPPGSDRVLGPVRREQGAECVRCDGTVAKPECALALALAPARPAAAELALAPARPARLPTLTPPPHQLYNQLSQGPQPTAHWVRAEQPDALKPGQSVCVENHDQEAWRERWTSMATTC